MSQVIILGIDGATLDLIEPWMHQGKLPAFSRISSQGAYGRLRSTTPYYSAPAWVSMVTGCNPGKHGIYDFFHTDTAQKKLVNSRYRKTPAIWQYLTDMNKKSIVVNVPGTFPPEHINGAMITGLLTPSPDSVFTYPPSLKNDLVDGKLGAYELEQVAVDDIPKNLTARYAPEKLAAQINRIITSHATVTLNLMDKYDWDFTMVVFRGTDDAMHLLWDHQDLILSCYQTADNYLDKMITQHPDALVLIVSDHGFTKPTKYLYVNNLLYNKGYLATTVDPTSISSALLTRWYMRLSRLLFHLLPMEKIVRTKLGRKLIMQSGASSNIDFLHTKAFYHSVCSRGIRINLKDKYKQGCVSSEEYEPLRMELSALFKKITDPSTGQPVVQRVYYAEEIYGDNAVNDPLDLILELAQGYGAQELLQYPDSLQRKMSDKSKKLPILSPPGFYDWLGDHAPYGVIFMYGPPVKKGTIEASIVDVVPTVLAYMNLPIPDIIDGHVITDAFTVKPKITRMKTEEYSVRKKGLTSAELRKIHNLRKKV